MNLFVRNSVFRPKEIVYSIIICFSSLFQSKIEGHTRSILAETASFGQKAQIPKLAKVEILKPKVISAETQLK